jgi:hypothetical protein
MPNAPRPLIRRPKKRMRVMRKRLVMKIIKELSTKGKGMKEMYDDEEPDFGEGGDDVA